MTAAKRGAGVRRVGLFGGTFNPIHLGHLRSAEEVCEALGLDEILFIPSATPPHKRGDGVAPAAQRLAMVKLAIAGNARFRVSTIEINRRGRSYSVDTLRVLRTRMPRTHFSFIMGIDAFREIATWKEYRSIFGLCDVVVISRPPDNALSLRAALPVAARGDFCYRPRSRTVEHSTGNRIIFQSITQLDISASSIRRRVRRTQSIRYLVPASVERYIARHGLYARGRVSSIDAR
jgi:nicotinate-nucleotide adenylyltransferase